jgi:hypothetical protein
MTIKSTIALIFVAGAMFAAADAALAQGRGRGQGNGPVASACASEIDRYCGHLQHGGGAVRRCLEAKRGRLSRSCRSTLNNTGFGNRWR